MGNRGTDQRARLGAHMSIAGGMHLAIDRASRVDATALQVFVKSARQWRAPALAPAEVAAFRRRLGEAGLGPYTMAHAAYLINPAAPQAAVRERSVAALRVEVERCAALGIPYLVLHPGSHLGAGESIGLRRAARVLDRVLDPAHRAARDRTAGVTVLLELTAGQGTNLGSRFEQLAGILERSRVPERLGVCFDTCHALAAGYEFRDARSYRRTFREFDRTIGLERLRGFHFNDSRHALGSRRDRHEHIGRGEVGLEAFRLILNDRRFRDRPMVLETPKGPDLLDDRRNLGILREMLPPTRR